MNLRGFELKLKDMKTYNEMKKEVDAMGKGEKKTVMRHLLRNIKKGEDLQKQYEALKNKLSEEERKRLAEFFE